MLANCRLRAGNATRRSLRAGPFPVPRQAMAFHDPLVFNLTSRIFAGVMELADVTDSKSVGLITRAGSTPATGTKTS